jgi:uncharacterized protein YceH (UPF0502 family)
MIEEPIASDTQAPELPLLTPIEARVLGCLMEKQRTTPDAYPLTLNALVTACNQKTSRNPVMHLEPGEVGHTLNELRDRGLVHASLTARSERYDHKMRSNYRLDLKQQAVLTVLMLRGPQTAAELRAHAGRLADLGSSAEVETTVRELEQRTPPLVIRLARLPGKREERHAHLLCGAVEQEAAAEPATAARAEPQAERIQALEAEVARLAAELDRLWELTGLSAERPQPEDRP